MGRSFPANETIEPRVHFPGCTAVTRAVKELSHSLRTKFISEKKIRDLRFVGAVMVDEVHLKVQRKHFYDFTYYIIGVTERAIVADVSFVVRNYTMCLVEGPSVPDIRNILEKLNETLSEEHKVTLDDFMSYLLGYKADMGSKNNSA